MPVALSTIVPPLATPRFAAIARLVTAGLVPAVSVMFGELRAPDMVSVGALEAVNRKEFSPLAEPEDEASKLTAEVLESVTFTLPALLFRVTVVAVIGIATPDTPIVPMSPVLRKDTVEACNTEGTVDTTVSEIVPLLFVMEIDAAFMFPPETPPINKFPEFTREKVPLTVSGDRFRSPVLLRYTLGTAAPTGELCTLIILASVRNAATDEPTPPLAEVKLTVPPSTIAGTVVLVLPNCKMLPLPLTVKLTVPARLVPTCPATEIEALEPEFVAIEINGADKVVPAPTVRLPLPVMSSDAPADMPAKVMAEVPFTNMLPVPLVSPERFCAAT